MSKSILKWYDVVVRINPKGETPFTHSFECEMIDESQESIDFQVKWDLGLIRQDATTFEEATSFDLDYKVLAVVPHED